MLLLHVNQLFLFSLNAVRQITCRFARQLASLALRRRRRRNLFVRHFLQTDVPKCSTRAVNNKSTPKYEKNKQKHEKPGDAPNSRWSYRAKHKRKAAILILNIISFFLIDVLSCPLKDSTVSANLKGTGRAFDSTGAATSYAWSLCRLEPACAALCW